MVWFKQKEEEEEEEEGGGNLMFIGPCIILIVE